MKAGPLYKIMTDPINNKFDKTIYKKDSKGKIRFLRVYNDGPELVQKSGIMGTDSPIEHRSTAKAKNVGKMNETTPEMQAMLEAGAKVNTKMSTGYFFTIEEAEEKGGANVILPMLAKDYKKEMKKINWNYEVYAQPKLDGMRALGNFEKIISRKGKDITTMNHIQESLEDAKGLTFDGELYAHGKSFQENMKLIKKDRGAETKEVKYHVYDLVLPLIAFSKRYEFLTQAVSLNGMTNIELVPTFPIKDENDLKRIHSKFIAEGYEGTIIRHSDDGYRVNRRSSSLLKYKDFQDITAEVIDIVPSDKKPEQGVVFCKADGEKFFHCGMKFSHKEREEILTNKANYIGQTAEIRFFEYSDDGLPRFPVCHGFRLDV